VSCNFSACRRIVALFSWIADKSNSRWRVTVGQ
jgi:hypothetical protein